MDKKNKLLSIGEVSNFTGAGVKALRYYERIGILKPAFVDPFTKYRYYSYNQIILVGLIMFCVELDIPLKELEEYIDHNETFSLQSFVTHGKAKAQDKIEKLQKGLSFLNTFGQKLEEQNKLPFEKIYKKHFDEKHYYLIPYEQTFDNVDQFEFAKLFLDFPYTDENYALLEYGYLCEYSLNGVARYTFVEVSKELSDENCKVIPGGAFYCYQSNNSKIESVKDIFKDYAKGDESLIAIETEVFSGKLNINRPTNELRIR